MLDWKLKIFGQEKLCQCHIGLIDLDEDTRLMLESGFFQVLPERDSRGRVIYVISPNLPGFYRNSQSFLQMTYYCLMFFAEDETNQMSGVVSVVYGLRQVEHETNMSSQNRYSTWESGLLSFCIPFRLEAMHICSPPSGMHYTMNLLCKAASSFQRARFRAHYGSRLECEYALQSFGIPTHLLPYTTEGQLKIGYHKKWIQRRIIMEQELERCNVFSGIELPRPNDILLGKGKPIQNHPGNRRLLELAVLYLDEYNQADRKGGRSNVARKIIQELLYPSTYGQQHDKMDHTGGGRARFLQRREDKLDSGWWEEVTDEDIMVEKALNAFRGVRKRNVIIAGRVKVCSDSSV
jgi:hypothetical protein